MMLQESLGILEWRRGLNLSFANAFPLVKLIRNSLGQGLKPGVPSLR